MQPSTNCLWSFSISRFERHVPIARRKPSDSRRREASDLDGDAHDLLLVEDHAHRILEHGLEAGVQVRHGLQPLLATQERVDGVALDRARPDDRHFHDEVVEGLWPRLGKRLHLGSALDLEDPDRVGRLEHLEDLRDVLGEAVEIDADRAIVLDQLERLVHRGQHPEPEQVELDELERLDVALVELDDDPVDHRGPLERRDVDERRGGHQHPARMDRQVAREAIDPGAELEPALPVREADRRAATGLGRRFRLDPRDRRRAAAAPWSARRGAGGSQRVGRPSLSVARPWSVARGGGSSWPLSGSIRRPSMSGGATSRSVSAL